MAGLAGREHDARARISPAAGGSASRSAARFCTSRAILFLDEPTGGVDPLSRRQFWRLIDSLSRSGVTVLVTTHYLDEAEHCHRVAIIHAGRLAAIGTTSEVKQVFDGRPILEIRADRPVEAMRVLDALPGVEKTSLFGTAVHAVLRRSRPGRAVGHARRMTSPPGCATPASGVEGIATVSPSLEDVFLDVVDRASSSPCVRRWPSIARSCGRSGATAGR